MNDNLSSQTTDVTSWYAMRVFMNKVPFCRDMFNIFNNVLLGVQDPRDDFPEDLMGEAMEYFAPFYIDTFTNAKGKRVEVERPLVPSLFFMKCSKRQAFGLEREMMGRARLYRRHTAGRQPIKIPPRADEDVHDGHLRRPRRTRILRGRSLQLAERGARARDRRQV